MYVTGLTSIIGAAALFVAAPLVTGLTGFGWHICLEALLCVSLPPGLVWALGEGRS